MFQVIEKEKDSVLVKMDIHTYNGLQEEVNEDLGNYEMIFEKPIPASELLKK